MTRILAAMVLSVAACAPSVRLEMTARETRPQARPAEVALLSGADTPRCTYDVVGQVAVSAGMRDASDDELVARLKQEVGAAGGDGVVGLRKAPMTPSGAGAWQGRIFQCVAGTGAEHTDRLADAVATHELEHAMETELAGNWRVRSIERPGGAHDRPSGVHYRFGEHDLEMTLASDRTKTACSMQRTGRKVVGACTTSGIETKVAYRIDALAGDELEMFDYGSGEVVHLTRVVARGG